MLDAADYKARVGEDPWTPLFEVADFNSLIALSQEHQVPVYGLTAEQAEAQGAVWTQTKKNMALFETEFAKCAEKVFALTS